MSTARARSGPLTVRIGRRDVTLLASEATTLIEAVELFGATIERSLDRLRHDQPRSLEAAQRRLQVIASLKTSLTTASPRFGDPPLELDAASTQVLSALFSELVGYKRQQLAPGLETLKLAVNSMR